MLKLNSKAVRFIVVGAVNTATDISIYMILRELGLAIFWANFCSSTIALMVSFVLNRNYTFQAHGSELRSQIMRFVPVTITGLWIIQPVVIFLLTPFANKLPAFLDISQAHEKLIIPKLAAAAFILIWNYLWYKNYVFVDN